MVLCKGYDKAADYWALGCLLYELTVADTPFADEYTTQIYRKIAASDEYLQFPEGIDSLLVDLIKRLLQHDSALRLGNMENGIDDIQNDPFFADINWKALSQRTIEPIFRPLITSTVDSSNFFNFDGQEEGTDESSAWDAEDEYTGRQDYFENF